MTIDDLAGEFWDHFTRTNPTEAHLLGDYRHAGAFEPADRASEDAVIAELRDFAARADAMGTDGLDEQQRLTRDILVSTATTHADLLEARLTDILADPVFGPQVSVPIVMGMFGVPDADVAAAMPDKLRGMATMYRAVIERLREGASSGSRPPAFAVSDTAEQIDAILARPTAEDPVLAAAARIELPEGVDPQQWRADLAAVVETDLRPAMAAYRDALREEVLPEARPDEQCGLSWLPDGAARYDATLRYFTTTTKSAQEIHEIGLAQIAQLAEEYRALGPEVVGTDDLAGIFEAMRSDPALHFSEGQQLVTASEVAMARAWEAMPDWFAVLPQAPCAVEATETGAKAFYFPPAADGSRGGTFFINIDDPTSWGTFELEAMAFHEGIPGHHLQLTIAGELTDVPDFRRHLVNSAYAEGWGLYTERLSDEMGLYSGPADRMGMLAADSMRACRLVVDTGLHALGWSREQAVQYMLDNSPLAPGVVRPEVDRYVVSPGQACSYMVGRLEIQRMRAEAEARQGDRFSIKAFHSAVLESGGMPLDVLDRHVAAALS